jgi:hypothetical protein
MSIELIIYLTGGATITGILAAVVYRGEQQRIRNIAAYRAIHAVSGWPPMPRSCPAHLQQHRTFERTENGNLSI